MRWAFNMYSWGIGALFLLKTKLIDISNHNSRVSRLKKQKQKKSFVTPFTFHIWRLHF